MQVYVIMGMDITSAEYTELETVTLTREDAIHFCEFLHVTYAFMDDANDDIDAVITYHQCMIFTVDVYEHRKE